MRVCIWLVCQSTMIWEKGCLKAGRIPFGFLCYPLEDCRKEINCYKQIYKIGKIQKIQPFPLFEIAERAFDTAAFGYLLHRVFHSKLKKVIRLWEFQGHPLQSDLFQTAVHDRNMQVRFSLKVVLKSWDDDMTGMNIFQYSAIFVTE